MTKIMAKTLHPKIQALRNKVGHKPIHYFYPSGSKLSAFPIEKRQTRFASGKQEGERLIKQYFCIFGIPDDYGTVPMKGAFTKSINERGPESQANNKIIVLNGHNQRDPMCLPLILKEDEIGLYAEYEPDPIQELDRVVMQIKRGTINGGSYGFNYVWDKMEYDEKTGLIFMYEVELFEISPVAIPSQKETFVVRSNDGTYIDEHLESDTESLIKLLPRKYHLEIRSIIDRHISLAKFQPVEQDEQTLDDKSKPQQVRKRILAKVTENLNL